MSTALGKRKREAKASKKEATQSSSEESNSLELDAQEIFRRHFEAQFKPLPDEPKKVAKVEIVEDEDSEDDDSEWDGISEGGGDQVEVIEHTDAESRMAAMSKEELKKFMVRGFGGLLLCGLLIGL